jgi:hypothetical protein
MARPTKEEQAAKAAAAQAATEAAFKLTSRDPEKLPDLVERVLLTPEAFGPELNVYRIDAPEGEGEHDEQFAGFVGKLPRDQLAEAPTFLAKTQGPGVFMLQLTGPGGAGFRGKAHVRVLADLRPKPPPVAAPVAPQSTSLSPALDREALVLDALRGLAAEVAALKSPATPPKREPDEVDKLMRLGDLMTTMLAKVPGGPGDRDSPLDAFKLGMSAGEKANAAAPWYGGIIAEQSKEVVGVLKDGGKLGWELLKEWRDTKTKDEEKKKKAEEEAKKKAKEKARLEAEAAAQRALEEEQRAGGEEAGPVDAPAAAE